MGCRCNRSDDEQETLLLLLPPVSEKEEYDSISKGVSSKCLSLLCTEFCGNVDRWSSFVPPGALEVFLGKTVGRAEARRKLTTK